MRTARNFRSYTLATLFLSISLVPACAPDSSLGEGEDVGEQTDALSGAQKCAVLKLANSADLDTLDNDVKLSLKAAKNIVAARVGADEILGTVDDEWFATYGELDAVSQVGPSTLKKLKSYAAEHGVDCGDVPVQVLAFNDYHGAMEPPTGSGGRIVVSSDPAVAPVNAGGAEFLATHIDTVRATNPNTVVVAAGDVIGASPLLSAAFHDEPTIESVNLMGLDIAAVGNHEFDEGIDELLRMQTGGCHPDDGCQDGDPFEGADFTYLAANVDHQATGETILPAYAVKQFGNARVGFIGVTLEGTPKVVTAAGTAGLTFHDEAETVNALVPILRSRGVETIVLLIHEGGAATGLYNACDGISGPIFEIVSNLDPAITSSSDPTILILATDGDPTHSDNCQGFDNYTDNPEAWFVRAMLRERHGDLDGAARAYLRAARSDPEGYPLPIHLEDATVASLIEESRRELHPAVQSTLDTVAFLVEDVPSEELCRQFDPPALPGEILGYFSGNTMAEHAAGQPSAPTIVLFRRNLERIAQDREHLLEEVRITVLHEIGHFLGLDEDDLEDRGLE